MSLLQLKEVSVFFEGNPVLREVSFEVGGGEILGIMGPNGAGKTTLFNVINGFHRPTSGEIFMNGSLISGYKPHEICRAGIARTFQLAKPFSRMSVYENLLAAAFLKAKNKKTAKEIAEEALYFAKLYDDQNLIAQKLVFEKRKRLEIARALATQPHLLLCDELFAGLAPSEFKFFIEMIKKIRSRGMTVLFIEHHMKTIMTLSDRIVVLTNGQKIADGPPDEVRNDPFVIDAYLGE